MKNRVKEARQAKALTQEALANQLNVSRQTIISIESNRYVPSTLLALKIANTLERKIEDLFILEDSDLL